MEPEETHIVREEPRPQPDGPSGPYRNRTVREDRYSSGPVVDTAAETEVVSRWSPARRAFDLVYFVFAIVDAFILIRILLKVLGANTAVAFTGFVYAVSDSLLTPFHGLLPTLVSGRSVFEMSAVFGLLVYALVGYLIARLIAIMFMRDVVVSHSNRGRGRYRPD